MNFISFSTPELKPAAQCIKSLNFFPRSTWPSSLPGVSIDGIAIAGFTQDLFFDYKGLSQNFESLRDLFFSLYPDLSFLELAQLQICTKNESWFPFESIAALYSVFWDESTAKVASLALDLPIEVKNWMIDRKVSSTDLFILIGFDFTKIDQLWTQFLVANPIKSTGIQILEQYSELSQIEVPKKDLDLQDNEKAEAWLLRLTKIHSSIFQDTALGSQKKTRSPKSENMKNFRFKH